MGKRLFVSVDLDGLAENVAAVQERFEDASGLRFTDPEQTHVTLKFLGDTDEDRVPELADELAAAVAFRFHTVGCSDLPVFRRPYQPGAGT